MTVMWDVQERSCAVCGRIFIPQAPKAKYCSEDCRRKHEQDRAKEARRRGARPKRDKVDRYLAPTGPAHDEIMAMPDVDGCLVGGASLKAEEFAKIAMFYA